MKRAVRWLAAFTLLLLVAFVLLVLWDRAVFDEYSRDFGSLTQERFHALNARMDALAAAARVVFVALGVSDLALVVLSARARALAVCVASVVFALLLAAFLLLSLARVSASMIG